MAVGDKTRVITRKDHLHIFENVPEPSTDGTYYLRVTKAGSTYTYTYVEDPIIGTAPPSVTPEFIGQTYIDTINKKVYEAIGTTDSGDFELMNGP